MDKIFITGSSGFVGSNLIKHLNAKYTFEIYQRGAPFCIFEDIVIHLAGISNESENKKSIHNYYKYNTELSKDVFNAFLVSNASVFIFLSSIKAVTGKFEGLITESLSPNPKTHYGKSKFLAEQYILSQQLPLGKRLYILRPCMIHGLGNKGNLNLLYKFVSKGIPWPLGAFENERSYCSIENLMFIFKELIERKDIPSGVYNISDDIPLSTNEVISILAESQSRLPRIWNISKGLIELCAKIGNVFKLPLNEERLRKLTDSYVVSNSKLMNAIGKPLPVSSREGLLKTFQSFQK